MQENFNLKAIKLIIGLGNPGKEYEKTYHNVGFLVIDYLTKNPPNHKFLKSTVYMNLSGSFVKKILKRSNTKPEELLIVHDDSDLNLGEFKLSSGSGSAGHNGIESIIKTLGTKDFWRLRIGIRPIKKTNQGGAGLPAEARRAKAGEFVLKNISSQNKKILESVFEKIKDSVFTEI